VWTNKTSLTQPRFIEMTVQSQEIERSCIYVRDFDYAFVSTIRRSDSGTVPTVFFFSFHFKVLLVFGVYHN